jgi:hypothetical protein
MLKIYKERKGECKWGGRATTIPPMENGLRQTAHEARARKTN